MSELSLDYYINVFRNSPQRLASVKDLLLKDFRNMEGKFFAYAEIKDLAAMRAELHKVKPIVFNLRFQRMLALIEKYHENGDLAASSLNELNAELKYCLAEIYRFLKTE